MVWRRAKKYLYGQSALGGSIIVNVSYHPAGLGRSAPPHPRPSPRSAQHSSYATVTPHYTSRTTNSIGYFTFVRLDYKRNERKRKPKVCVEKKDADPITRWGQVQICLRSAKTNKRDNEASQKTSEEACGNYNAPGVFTVIKQNRR